MTRADIEASDGVIHAIDLVLVPQRPKGDRMSEEKKPFRFENTDDLLIAYTGNEHVGPEVYQTFFDAWIERLQTKQRFGVVLVTEPHEHHAEEGRDGDEEDAFTRVLNDFRRHHKTEANFWTTGFSRVFTPEMLEGISDEKWEQHQEASARMAEYMFGVRGKNFTDFEEAKAWFHSIENEAPLDISQKASEHSSGIGFYYGSTTGTTMQVAEKMQSFAGMAGMNLTPINISDLKDPKELTAHEQLILGIPTWNIGQLQDDWIILFPKLDELDFSGKQVALFGLGDQRGYPDNFLDAVGTLGDKLLERGARLVGYWSADDYEFDNSKALVDDKFMGLGIDVYNQDDKTDSRIMAWLQQIQKEFMAARQVAESVN